MTIFSASQRRIANGTRGSLGIWSDGRPKRYFGMIQAPRRAARQVSLGDVGALDGDVHRAVAHAEDDDVLVAQHVVGEVLVGVHLLDRGRVVAGERGLGPARVPVVAVGDDQRVVLALEPPCPWRHAPAAVGRGARRVSTPRLEADAVAEAEVVDVVVEVRRDLRVVRVVGVRLRHREVRVLHPLARGVDVQPLVGRAHPVAVAEDPVAADPVGLLEAVERDALLVEGLGGGDAGGAGADDRDGREGHARHRSPKVTQASTSA